MKTPYWNALLVIVLLLAGCDANTIYTEVDARVHWQGSYAVDGCGMFVEIDGNWYKPSNEATIDTAYFKDSLAVVVDYYHTDPVDYACGFAGLMTADGVHIVEIDLR